MTPSIRSLSIVLAVLMFVSCGKKSKAKGEQRKFRLSVPVKGSHFVGYYRREGDKIRHITFEEMQELHQLGRPDCWSDWTDGIVYAMVKGNILSVGKAQRLANRNQMKYAALKILQQRIRGTLSLLVSEVMIDQRRKVNFFTKTQSNLSRWFQNYLNGSILHDIRYSRDGTDILLVHKLYLFGKGGRAVTLRSNFLNLVQDRYLRDLFARFRKPVLFLRSWERPYTSIVIDARHFPDFRPAINTCLLDEGLEVFFPLKIEGKSMREQKTLFIANGRITYISDPWYVLYLRKLGDNPFYMYASGIAGKNKCDILLTSFDCKRFLNRQESLAVLRKGQIFIVAK